MEASDSSASTIDSGSVASPESLCWICLEPSTSTNPLTQPCACPWKCHTACLSRWQLQSAGKSEETHCRFCNSTLPLWTDALLEKEETPKAKPNQIIMGIKFRGKTYKVKFEEGVVGAEKFKKEVRKVLQLPNDVDIDANFIVHHPQTGEKLTLSGFRAYDAAAQLAAINAAKRCSQPTTSCSQSGQISSGQQSQQQLSSAARPGIIIASRVLHAVKRALQVGSRCMALRR